MKLYLAGPMTGYPELNFPLFHDITARLRGKGFEIVNPAEVNSDPSAKWVDCMRADIAALLSCDGVAVLSGRENSRGAVLEHHIASSLGMPTYCAYALAGIIKTK